MATNKHIDRICVAAVVIALLISVLFMNGEALGIQAQASEMGYESRLFDATRVHTIDIVIDDWDSFLQTCQSEEYSLCSVVIDGEAFKNVGIRGKGNTSLSTVASMDSDRYSFKIEFDQYDSTKSYYGLDKLSLNNLIQDNTMMKDYLTYTMMNRFGVAAPLCSYVYITVNGEDWGLYLAVEAVEESFLQRNYGTDYGELYKPDSIEMGGGRGNGRDFDFEDFMSDAESGGSTDVTMPSAGGMQGGQMMPGIGGDTAQQPTMPEGFDPTQTGGMMPGVDDTSGEVPTMPEDFDPSQMEGVTPGGDMGGLDMGMGSGDVKLQYIDDDPDSYSSIFDNAKTDVSTGDQNRLIASLKALGSGENIENVVDMEAVIRYFVVHNFVVNADSYTGSMVHNYYLYEEDGQLSMIPWDYNLAFGTFQGSNASDAVNDDIDAPLSVTGSGDRPMFEWILSNEKYTALYHSYFREFLDTVDIEAIISQAYELIAPYVEKDPTKFCTYEEFETGVQTLTDFCTLRSQSAAAQLDGKAADIDASSINLSDMGTMNNTIGGGDIQLPQGDVTQPDASGDGEAQIPTMPEDGLGMAQMPGQTGGMQVPGQTGTGDSVTPPDGMELPDEMEMPDGMGTMIPGMDTQVQSGSTAQGGNQWLLLGVTLVILAAGLLFAIKYKR